LTSCELHCDDMAAITLQVHAGDAATDWLVTDSSSTCAQPHFETIWTHVQQDLQEINT